MTRPSMAAWERLAMGRMVAAVLRVAVVLGAVGAVLLWAAGVFALSIGVWQYAGLALILATGLGVTAYAAQRIRRGLTAPRRF